MILKMKMKTICKIITTILLKIIKIMMIKIKKIFKIAMIKFSNNYTNKMKKKN